MGRALPLAAVALVVGFGCSDGPDDAGDPAPGFARVQAEIDARDRDDPIPRLDLAVRGPARRDKVTLSQAEWKRRLTPARYAILRDGGTETPGGSPLLKEGRAGVFRCAACDDPLFPSDAKYDSGTGWPSFVRPVAAGTLWYRLDRAGGLRRVEILCARCDGHLGHVFDDGPTGRGGLRYCMNGDALTFRPASP